MEQVQSENYKADYQKLLDRIDKNCDGWIAVQEYKDQLYRRFFNGAASDHEYKIDVQELEDFIEKAIEMISAQFEPNDNITNENIRDLLEVGTVSEWEKRTEKVEDNLSMGETAIVHAFKAMNTTPITSLVENPGSSN